MNIATWKSIKSPIMQEIRIALKGKSQPGQPTPSKKEANRVWREEILNIKSEEQKQAAKAMRQRTSNKKKSYYKTLDQDE